MYVQNIYNVKSNNIYNTLLKNIFQTHPQPNSSLCPGAFFHTLAVLSSVRHSQVTFLDTEDVMVKFPQIPRPQRKNNSQTKTNFKYFWLVVSTHLKNMLVKLDHYPK